MRQDLPVGTVTLVFTDIEGSTRLLEELGTERYGELLSRHHRVCRVAWQAHGGVEVDTSGDAFFVVFESASGALAAAGEAQVALAELGLRVRMGVHTGEVAVNETGYVGFEVHRAARIAAAAHGGQVVVSDATAALVGHDGLVDLGEHRFKDLSAAERVFQLGGGEFPPLKSLYRSNLPVPATQFLGREVELGNVLALLRDPVVRLLTLCGPGGTGKTRLALEAAAEASDGFPDGVFWIALAPLRDPALLMPAVAHALDVREQSGEELADTVARALLDKKTLLLIDNCEHLLPQLALDLAALLAACPTLRILATSRERLHVQAETTWAVPTLSDSDGHALFLERARAVRSDFELNEDVSTICATLDHLPLAIELAAARVRSLSTRAIVDRLGERLSLLTTRARDVDERQRTLEATIAWSYDLLDAEEQRALRALSVFAGGADLDAATRVARADLDLLEVLVDKSLLRHRVDNAHDRYWMLETVREYVASRLEAGGERESVFDAFLDWLDAVVGEVDELWVDRDQLGWFRTLDRERDNLMHGVTSALTNGRAERALRLVAAADEFVDAWGPYAPFADLTTDASSGDADLDRRTRLLHMVLLLRLGRLVEATREADAAMPHFDGSPGLQGRLLSFRSFCSLQAGDPVEARKLALSGVDLARQGNDVRGIASSLNSLGLAEMTLGRHDECHAHLRESDAISMEKGDVRNATIARGSLALALLADRKPEAAAELLREITGTVRLFEGPPMTALQLANLAIGLAASKDAAAARAALSEALELDTLQFEESLAIEGLLILAIAAAHEGAPEVAVTLWSAADAANARAEYVVGPELQVYVVDVLEPLRSRPHFEEHWELGGSLPPDHALRLGLNPRDGG